MADLMDVTTRELWSKAAKLLQAMPGYSSGPESPLYRQDIKLLVEALGQERERSFKDAPVSLAEVRSDRSESAKDWRPRDVVISMLRKIDSGDFPADTDVMVLMYGGHTDGKAFGSYSISSPSLNSTLGVIEHSKFKMLVDGYHIARKS